MRPNFQARHTGCDQFFIEPNRFLMMKSEKVNPLFISIIVGVIVGSLTSIPIGLIPGPALDPGTRLLIMTAIGLVFMVRTWMKERGRNRE